MNKFQKGLKKHIGFDGNFDLREVIGISLIAHGYEDFDEVYEDIIIGERDNFQYDPCNCWVSCADIEWFMKKVVPDEDGNLEALDVAYDDYDNLNRMYKRIMYKIRIKDSPSKNEIYDFLDKVGYHRLTFFSINERRYYIYTQHI